MTALPDITGLQSALAPSPATRVCVLDADPDLAAAVDPHERELAVRYSAAPAFACPRGPWTFAPPPDRAALGALILRGLILVRIEVGSRAHAELLGPGDIISPWVQFDGEITVPSDVVANAVEPVEIALLDADFSRRIARWPQIHASLVNRLILRSRRLSLQAAINAIPRTQERLELTLWQLGHRFGRVASAGLKLRLPISQGHLSEIVATQRPSVTIALGRLEEAGRLKRAGSHEWLLCGSPPAELTRLARELGVPMRSSA